MKIDKPSFTQPFSDIFLSETSLSAAKETLSKSNAFYLKGNLVFGDCHCFKMEETSNK